MLPTRVLTTATLFGLLATTVQAQQTMPATAKPMTMDEKMRVCAKMHVDMAHNRPMTANGMKLMDECQRMDREMGAAPAPAATLDR